MLYTSLTLILNYLTVMVVITLSLDRVEPVTSGSDAKANTPPHCSHNDIFLASEYYITVCVWQFLCLKNIRVFLQTCRTVFQMPDDHLFEPNDLFDIKDFGKVCVLMLWYIVLKHCLQCFDAVAWAARRASIQPVKNWVVISGVWCKWFAYGPADATATPSSLAPVKSRMVYLSGAGLPRMFWNKSH